MNEITAAIKKKAEEKYKPAPDWYPGIEERTIMANQVIAYTCGGEDATQRDIDFLMDIVTGDFARLLSIREHLIHVGRFHAFELLIKYMEDNKL